MKLLGKKILGEWSAGEKSFSVMLKTYKPFRKADEDLVNEITRNTGEIISTRLQSRYLFQKELQQGTDQQGL